MNKSKMLEVYLKIPRNCNRWQTDMGISYKVTNWLTLLLIIYPDTSYTDAMTKAKLVSIKGKCGTN